MKKERLLHAALFTPCPDHTWGLPLILWGFPGVAKSSIFRKLAKAWSMPIEVLSPSSRGEGAFGVTPVPKADRMTYPRPDWTDKFEGTGRGIVFVDEMNLAASHYAGALLGLVQDRIIGSHRLGPKIRVVAAANPTDLAAASGGWDLSAPAANRLGHIDWTPPTAAEWCEWLLLSIDEDILSGEAGDAGDEEARVEAVWPEAWAYARGIVTGFLTAHSSHLLSMPKNATDTGKAWPSPRTWEYATRAIASSECHRLTTAERDEFIAAFIGQGATLEFVSWLAKADLPDSAALLDGKVTWKHKKSRLDISTAVFGSAAATVVGTSHPEQKKARSEVLWKLLSQAADDAPDIIIVPAKTLVRDRAFYGAQKVLSKLSGILEAAGIQIQV